MSSPAPTRRWSSSLALEESVARRAVRGGVGVTVPRVLHDALLRYETAGLAGAERDDRALLVVAVARHGRPAGVLAVTDRSGRGFGDHDVEAAERLAAMAAPAMGVPVTRGPVRALLCEILDALDAQTAALYALVDGDRRLALVAACDRPAR